MIAVRLRLNDANFVVTRCQRTLDAAIDTLEKANERWAVEREGVYYKGGRFLGYLYHRFATGSYRYLGLTASAAETCRAALDALLTRHIAKSATLDDGVAEVLYQDANPSSVRAVLTAGDNYSVEVEISEDDVLVSPLLVEPATLFATENQRRYFAYEQNAEA